MSLLLVSGISPTISMRKILSSWADPYRQTIHKCRQSFIWQGQFFEVDRFLSPVDDLIMMEVKGIVEQENIKFPPFVKVLEEVTGNSRFYNYNIALRK